jgi:hypothetical protein
LSEGFFNYQHVNSTGVNAISVNGAGLLHAIVFNQLATNAVTASTGLTTIYDSTTTAASTSPTVIGIIGQVAGIPEYIYDIQFKNGLTLQVGSGVTPLDITVAFR